MADPDEARSQTFADLLDAHGAAAMAMLRRLCRGGHDADDAFQETAARVWRHLAAHPWFAPRPWVRNPRAWVMTIAYRAFLDSLSRRRADEPLGERPDRRDEGPDRRAERAEADDRLRSALAGLSGPVREVVVLHYTGGLTIAQVAVAMGISGGTVKSRLNAGLTRLRAALAATDSPGGVASPGATPATAGRPVPATEGEPA